MALLAERGWGDGLPVVAPTAERIEAMLAALPASCDPDEPIATLPPRNGVVTRRVVAVNAVLAGCTPEVMPVLVSAARALGHAELNLQGVQATTHPVAPLLIVHGPIAQTAGFNGELGAFGPGSRANATTGRAVRFLLMHVGGARPGNGDASTQGQPSKYTYCVAENAAASPWPPYASTCGVIDDNAVTIACCENPHNAHDMWSDEPRGILDVVASVVAQLGGNNGPVSTAEIFIGLCPEHAATIAGAGWSRTDVQQYLYDTAVFEAGARRRIYRQPLWAPWMHDAPDDAMLPMTESPSNYRIFVVGGAGKHSCVMPSWGVTKSVTIPIAP